VVFVNLRVCCNVQIEAAKGRASKFVDSILRLSNVEAIGKYLLGSSQSTAVSSGFDNKVIGSAVTDVQVMHKFTANTKFFSIFITNSIL